MTARESPTNSPRSHSYDDSQPMIEDDEAFSLPPACSLAENIDVLICRAAWLHYLGAYQVRLHHLMRPDPPTKLAHPYQQNQSQRPDPNGSMVHVNLGFKPFLLGCLYTCGIAPPIAREGIDRAGCQSIGFSCSEAMTHWV